MWIDTHAHYDAGQFKKDRELLFLDLKAGKNIDKVVNVGTDIKTSKLSIEFSEKHNFIYAACGIHPHDAKDFDKKEINILRKMLDHPKVVALGEIGLDYFKNYSPKDVQKEVFKMQLDLAKFMDIPVIIHDRDAHEDVMDILFSVKYQGLKGVFHCYSGSLEMAKQIIKKGFFIGFDGPVTYKNAKKAVKVIENIPVENIVIETDCPYLSPEPLRGKRNDSRNLSFIAEKISELKNISLPELSKILKENSYKLFPKMRV